MADKTNPEMVKTITDQVVAALSKTNILPEQSDTVDVVDKKIASRGQLLTNIEVFVIFFALYILPIPMLFVDNILAGIAAQQTKAIVLENAKAEPIKALEIGKGLCQFYENQGTAIMLIFTALMFVFLGKTMTKAWDGKVEQLQERKKFGSVITAIVGVGIFMEWVIVAPLLNYAIPYINTYLKNIMWTTLWYILVVGGLYIFNKIIIINSFSKETFGKLAELMEHNTEDSKGA